MMDSERKRLEAEVEFLREVIDTIPALVFVKDREGRFILANTAVAEAYGTTVEGLTGRRDADFARAPADVEAFRKDDREVMDGMAEKFIAEESLVDAQGRTRWLQTVKRPLGNAAGKATHVLGVATDITQRKRLEAQLRQAQRMEAVGSLAGGIAHDFNNILTAILGFCHFLLQSIPRGDPRREDVEEIRASGERAANLTRQLLAFSRRQVLHPVVLDPAAVIADMEKLLRRLIGEHIALRTSRDPDLWRVHADPGQLEQVVMNLAVNARDAMPEGGSLSIRLENVVLESSPNPRILDFPAGEYVQLVMSDTGCGMDEAAQGRVFEPFFTTKEKGKGTGLGLSTVYGIVKQSGGFVFFTSEVGKGTTFTVLLPRSTESLPALPSASPSGEGLAAGTVLLVEDEEPVRRMVRRILEEAGHTVLEAAEGEAALELASGHPDKIDVLLSDVVMPGLSGPEVARRFRELRPESAVLLMSGYLDDGLVRESIRELGLPLLEKPFTAEDLKARLCLLLERG